MGPNLLMKGIVRWIEICKWWRRRNESWRRGNNVDKRETVVWLWGLLWTLKLIPWRRRTFGKEPTNLKLGLHKEIGSPKKWRKRGTHVLVSNNLKCQLKLVVNNQFRIRLRWSEGWRMMMAFAWGKPEMTW